MLFKKMSLLYLLNIIYTLLVVNALRQEPHNTHFNLKEALEFIAIVQPGRAYLTHISHHLGFHDEVQKTLPENVFLAYDNLEINI
jgi:phosphoribosyl 1,2-cyclic phosphate phosphodiesterase